MLMASVLPEVTHILNENQWLPINIVHGLLTAICSCPTNINSVEWMIIISKGQFSPDKISDSIKKPFIKLLAEIKENLENENFILNLEYHDTFNINLNENYYQEWMQGYSLGISVAFFIFKQHSNQRIWSMLMAIAAIGDSKGSNRDFWLKTLKQKGISFDTLKQEIFEQLHKCIQEIYNFFHKNLVYISSNATIPLISNNINQLCQCGSNKQYKVCCMIN